MVSSFEVLIGYTIVHTLVQCTKLIHMATPVTLMVPCMMSVYTENTATNENIYQMQ